MKGFTVMMVVVFLVMNFIAGCASRTAMTPAIDKFEPKTTVSEPTTDAQAQLRDIILSNPGALGLAFAGPTQDPRMSELVNDPVANLFQVVCNDLMGRIANARPTPVDTTDITTKATHSLVPEGLEIFKAKMEKNRKLLRDSIEETAFELLYFQACFLEINTPEQRACLQRIMEIAPKEMTSHVIICQATSKTYEAVFAKGGEKDFLEARRLLDKELPKFLRADEIETNISVERLNYNLAHYGYGKKSFLQKIFGWLPGV